MLIACFILANGGRVASRWSGNAASTAPRPQGELPDHSDSRERPAPFLTWRNDVKNTTVSIRIEAIGDGEKEAVSDLVQSICKGHGGWFHKMEKSKDGTSAYIELFISQPDYYGETAAAAPEQPAPQTEPQPADKPGPATDANGERIADDCGCPVCTFRRLFENSAAEFRIIDIGELMARNRGKMN